jgi:hypothetical protein
MFPAGSCKYSNISPRQPLKILISFGFGPEFRVRLARSIGSDSSAETVPNGIDVKRF